MNHNVGLIAYLGTNDLKAVEQAVQLGDEKSKLYLEAMRYHIAREIGAGSTVLKGECDAIILTGLISSRVVFIAPVILSSGSDENLAIAEAATRALNDTEEIKIY